MNIDIKKHTPFYYIGWAFIIAGLTIFGKFYFNADSYWISQGNFKDSIQTVVSLCGMLFALAALFFTLDNLKLQRITLEQQNISIEQQKLSIDLQSTEMKASNEYFKQQNETLKTQSKLIEQQTNLLYIQQKENTLNNILKNYYNYIQTFEFTDFTGDKIIGNLALNSVYHSIRSNIESYMHGYSNHSFSYSAQLYYQYNQLLKDEYGSYVTPLINNFTFHHQFIRDNFQNRELYFRLLFLSYSDAEKYLIGLFIINVTGKDDIYTRTYDFTHFAKEKIIYDFKFHYLPILEMGFLFGNKLDIGIVNTKTVNDTVAIGLVDYDVTMKQAPDVQYLSFTIIENLQKLKLIGQLLRITFNYSRGPTSINSIQKYKDIVIDDEGFKIPIERFLRVGMEYIDNNGGVKINNQVEVNIKAELDISINKTGTEEIFQIPFQKNMILIKKAEKYEVEVFNN